MNVLRAKHLDKIGLFSVFNTSNCSENAIRMYFSKKKWDKLSELSKTKFINEKRNYDYLLSLGLHPQKPLFMQLVKGDVSTRDDEDDDDFSWPKKKKKRLLVRFGPKRKIMRRRKPKIGARIDGFECQVCNTMFSSRDFLANHEKSHRPTDNEVKEEVCTHCSYSCNKKQDMERHMRIHTSERPHKCPICRKTFNRIHHLTTHRYTHSKESPYECEECGQGFTILSNLRRHERTHDKITPHVCKICGRQFARKEHVTDHMYTHSKKLKPLKCEHCRYRTTRSHDLQNHVIIKHTLKYPFSCFNCAKGFVAPRLLRHHIERYSCCPRVEVCIEKMEIDPNYLLFKTIF